MAAKKQATKRAAKKPAPRKKPGPKPKPPPRPKAEAPPKINPQDAAAREREELGLRRRAQGWGYAEIGRELKITRQGARKLVRRAYERLAEDVLEETAHARDLELERNDQILRAWWGPMKAGDEKAAGVVLRALEQRHRILGLEAVRKIEIKHTGPDLSALSDEELEALEALLAKTEGGEG